MAHSRNILPSSNPSDQPSRDDTSTISRSREPLAHSYSAGNTTSVGIYHDNKGAQPRADMPWMMPTVPSQPRQPTGSTLDLRRQSTRRRRHLRCSRNPIVDSPQYQAYRNRQNREGNPEDAIKWPEMLEHAFLDGTYYSSRYLGPTLTNIQPCSKFHRWEGGNFRIEGSLTVGMN
jgi:transcriptional enhancer factor